MFWIISTANDAFRPPQILAQTSAISQISLKGLVDFNLKFQETANEAKLYSYYSALL